jgi:hypothetical protein
LSLFGTSVQQEFSGRIRKNIVSSVSGGNGFNSDIQWFRQRGVPACYLDQIVDGFTTAFEETDPKFGDRVIAQFFDALKLHPLLSNGPSPDRTRVGLEMEKLLSPLVGFLGRLREPLAEGSREFVQMGRLLENFGKNIYSPKDEPSRSAAWFRGGWFEAYRQ